MKNDKGERQFYHYASTVEPATVIFTKPGPIIELGLKTASTWKKFEVYEGDKKLPVELVSYDSDKDYAYIRFPVSNGTKLKLCHLLNMVRTSMKTMIIR